MSHRGRSWAFTSWGAKANVALRASSIAAVLGSAACTMTVGQNALFPPRREALPAMAENVTRTNVQLLASDGVALRGWYLQTPGSERTVLFFYGNRSTVVSSTWDLHWMASALDANVVAFDYRGYGFSGGAGDIDRMMQDALDLHGYVVRGLGRGALPLIVVGQSMGTAAALHVAANRDVHGLVLLAPPGSVDDLFNALRAQAPWYVRVEPDASLTGLRVSPLRDAARVQAPTLFVYGSGDTLATPGAVARLVEACAAPLELECRLPGGHGDIRFDNPDVRRCVAGFVQDNASPAASLGTWRELGRIWKSKRAASPEAARARVRSTRGNDPLVPLARHPSAMKL